jgi:hypothetical protein
MGQLFISWPPDKGVTVYIIKRFGALKILSINMSSYVAKYKGCSSET